jgi:hypothetical protein
VTKCKSRTKTGGKCSANAGDTGFCWAHDPTLAEKRAQAHRQGGKQHRIPKVAGPAVQIASADDCLQLVNKVVVDTWELENSAARSRVLLQAASTAMDVLQIGELEERVKALEQIVAEKNSHGQNIGKTS